MSRWARLRTSLSRAALAAALTGLVGGLLAAAPASTAPASAAEDFAAVLQLSTSVNRATHAPGQSIDYTIAVDCLTDDCVGARLVDVLPPEFDALTLNPSVVVTGGTSTTSWSGRTLTVDFTGTTPNGPGIPSGGGYSVQVSLTIPTGLSPDWPSNGVAVTNTATVNAQTAATVSDAVETTVVVPYSVATAATATWSPGSTQFKVGEASSLVLSTRNTSNARADRLELSVPADPAATGSLFDAVRLTGFGAVSFPAGADRVQVDALVDGTWSIGAPGTTPALVLPEGRTAADVTGLRVRFTSSAGTAIEAAGASGSISITLAQRSSRRTSGESLITGATITAVIRGAVSVPGQTAAETSTSATYVVGPLTSVVTGTLALATSRIPAGTGTVATITGRNASNGPLASLVVSHPTSSPLLADGIAFGGFRSAGAAWPAGATAATLTWFVDAGTAPESVSLGEGEGLPTAPPMLAEGQRIIGFAVEYTGAIAVGATAAVPFRLDVADDAVPVAGGSVQRAATARIEGINDAGVATPQTPGATLTVVFPQVDVALTASAVPSAAVPAGGRAVVSLRATTDSDSGFVTPTTIRISDVRGGAADDLWRAFDAVAVAPTQIPAGATLTVDGTEDGVTWSRLDERTAGATAVAYQLDLAGDGDLVGLRFTFRDEDGFGQGTTVQANIAFQARSTLRPAGDDSAILPTSTEGAPTPYTTSATVFAEGEVQLDGGVRVSDQAAASASASIKTIPAGSGGMRFGSGAVAWVPVSGSTTVFSQSGQQRTARVQWGTEISGYADAELMTPADPSAPVGSTVFQAFDLVRIAPITPATDPYIAYDQVTGLELFRGGSWRSVFAAACTATGADCTGQFTGYTLSAAERADTTAVRITFGEYAGGRSSDAIAPPVGSGVASGPDARRLDLVFAVRNAVRDTGALAAGSEKWVTADAVFNATDPGLVRVDARLRLDALTGDAAASIAIVDPDPAITLAKSALNASNAAITAPIAIPVAGDVPAASYPVVRFSMSAANSSLARAWYLRVTDHMPCTTETVQSDCAHPSGGGVDGWTVNPYAGRAWDPATSPFDAFTITDLSYTLSANSGIDVSRSTVTYWYANGSNATVPLATANSAAASAFVDVVGVSALFASSTTADGGTIANGATATLVLQTQLRQTLRSAPGTRVGPRTIVGAAFAQGWDGVFDQVDAYAARTASVTLIDAAVDVVATTSASAPTILEKDRGTDVTVTLGANQGTSTASVREVTVEETSAAFWNAFDLRSLGAVTLPTGADRVRVDAQLDGSTSWTLGTAAASAALPPGVAAGRVTGIRFVYSRADGSLFSASAPAAAWSASGQLVVRLRSTDRSSGSPIAFPGSIAATVRATAVNTATLSDTATTGRSTTLATGTFRVDVEARVPVKTTPAGETLTWTLVVTNTGTGYLDAPVLVDQLPADASLPSGGPLVFDPTSEIGYATSAGGILPTTAATVAWDAGTRRLTFSWPTGSRLAPGEKYEIAVPLQVAPGLPATYGDIVNQFTFSSSRTLSACTNASGNGEGVSTVGTTGCRTSNDVRTISASAISSFKGVQGNVDPTGVVTAGAVNTANPATPCVADAQGYYRNPCAANTVVGATDRWKLQFTNGGNVEATGAVLVDVLPRPGDTYLGTGAARGSTYRPVFAGDVALSTDALSAGTTMNWEVTTAANPCPSYASNPTCSTAAWVAGSAFPTANYAAVTAIRVSFAFPGGALPPAATLAVTYETVNRASTAAGDSRVPTSVPLATHRAWNSFGVSATFPEGFTARRVEPVRAGVQIGAGPLAVVKAITGAGAAYAPTSFAATTTCTVGGVALTLPDSGQLTLAASNGTPYAARIDGLPVGAVCRVVETTTGASSVSYQPAAPTGPAALVTVGTAGGSASAVADGSTATITNEYGTTELLVAQEVSTAATVGRFGPFGFTLACTADTGTAIVAVPLDPADAAFALADGESRTISGLPVTARCELRQTDADDAHRVRISIEGASPTTVTQGQAVRIPLGTAPSVRVDVVDEYDAGRLAVTKTVTGAAEYGTGPFEVHVTCDDDGEVVADTRFELHANETETLETVFPAGTECAVIETDAGGATDPADPAAVLIPAPAANRATGLVTVGLTNRFDTGTLRIDASELGASPYHGGDYAAQVTCTWDKPGAPDLVIPLPDAGRVTFSAGTAGVVTGLIAGADCGVVESGTGGATVVTVSAPHPAVVPAGGASVVTITNEFRVQALVVEKLRSGDGADRFGQGPFEVAVECGYLRDGVLTAIALGDDATLTLAATGDYRAKVEGLLVGATCVVEETEPGLAVHTAYSPADRAAVIPADGDAHIVVTNTFRVGTLDIEKHVSVDQVQGGDELRYTLSVENTGPVDAAGVTIADELDPALRLVAAAGSGWACTLDGAGADGFGGVLTCVADETLAAGANAAAVLVDVAVRHEVSQDVIRNESVVTSTTPIVDGDRDHVDVEVRWLEATAASRCVGDAPWLDLVVRPHHIDAADSTAEVRWLDADGDAVHTEEVVVGHDGRVDTRLLWPGAQLDAEGHGVAWPGWRPAGPDESSEWENLVLDPAAFGYGLREGGSVEVRLDAVTVVPIEYPASGAECGETPAGQEPELWLTKVASTSVVAAGDRFEYTMSVGNGGLGAVTGLVLIDDVPDSLRILDVAPGMPADGTAPAWLGCEISGRGADGFGGTITCELDRDLGFEQVAPPIVLSVQLDPDASAGRIVNTAKVTAYDVPDRDEAERDAALGDLVTLSLEDSATILTPGRLAVTGAALGAGGLAALLLLVLGASGVAVSRRRVA